VSPAPCAQAWCHPACVGRACWVPLPVSASTTSQLNLVDLAGSERVLRSGATGVALQVQGGGVRVVVAGGGEAGRCWAHARSLPNCAPRLHSPRLAFRLCECFLPALPTRVRVRVCLLVCVVARVRAMRVRPRPSAVSHPVVRAHPQRAVGRRPA
jgi:hypothetical protein